MFKPKSLLFPVLLLGVLAAQGACAHGGGIMLDMSMGGYPGGYYSPVPVLVLPPPPQTIYVDQQTPEVQAEPQPAHYWYHCAQPQGYYPYVTECPGGWTKVSPQPRGQ